MYVHHVLVHIGLYIKHWKLCIHTGSVSLSDCPASIVHCMYSTSGFISRCFALYQASETARTQNLAHCFEPRAQCDVTDKSLPASTVDSSGGNYERQKDKGRLDHELDDNLRFTDSFVFCFFGLFF